MSDRYGVEHVTTVVVASERNMGRGVPVFSRDFECEREREEVIRRRDYVAG